MSRDVVIRDYPDNHAISIEHSTSVSHKTTVKVFDTMPRLSRWSGEAIDDESVYTQVTMKDALELLRLLESDRPIKPCAWKRHVTRSTALEFLKLIQRRHNDVSLSVLPHSADPKTIYTDNLLELIKSCKDLNWNLEKCTPHRSKQNGTATEWKKVHRQCAPHRSKQTALRPSERRYIVSFGAIRSIRKFVEGSHGTLSLLQSDSRLFDRW